MKNLALFSFLFIFGCSLSEVKSPMKKDIFDTIFEIRKDPKINRLTEIFGKPTSIKMSIYEGATHEYDYEPNEKFPSLTIFVNTKINRIISYAVTLSLEVDTYEYLKNRFKGHEWIETELPSKAVDFVEEPRRVQIPGLGITFDYDNQDPLRRPLWIFVE